MHLRFVKITVALFMVLFVQCAISSTRQASASTDSAATDTDPQIEAAIAAAARLRSYLDSHWALARRGVVGVAIDISGQEPVLDVQAQYSPNPAAWSWQQQLTKSGVVPKTFEGFATEVTEVPVLNSF
jgi:hypothetical protein